jgi:uncharacterized membrane protein YczE
MNLLRLAGRLVNLYVGLVLFGVSMAMLVEADLGLIPWDVLHQGISRHTGWSLGTTVIVAGFVVLLLWIPLRERPGFGTISNVVVIGLALDESVRLLPTPSELPGQIALVAGGIALNAFATLLYLNARMGSGPRDGLLTGLLRVTRAPAGVLKVAIEVGVVLVGWLLGGTVGVATIAFALSVGPMIQLLGRILPALALVEPAPVPVTPDVAPEPALANPAGDRPARDRPAGDRPAGDRPLAGRGQDRHPEADRGLRRRRGAGFAGATTTRLGRSPREESSGPGNLSSAESPRGAVDHQAENRSVRDAAPEPSTRRWSPNRGPATGGTGAGPGSRQVRGRRTAVRSNLGSRD